MINFMNLKINRSTFLKVVIEIVCACVYFLG
jgi:hypothetical protein